MITWKGAISPGQRLVDGMRVDWDKPPADVLISDRAVRMKLLSVSCQSPLWEQGWALG